MSAIRKDAKAARVRRTALAKRAAPTATAAAVAAERASQVRQRGCVLSSGRRTYGKHESGLDASGCVQASTVFLTGGDVRVPECRDFSCLTLILHTESRAPLPWLHAYKSPLHIEIS